MRSVWVRFPKMLLSEKEIKNDIQMGQTVWVSCSTSERPWKVFLIIQMEFATMISISWGELEEPRENFETPHAVYHVDFKAN